MADAPYLIALSVLKQDGERALPLVGKSFGATATATGTAAQDAGEEGRTLVLELLLHLRQRSDDGHLRRAAGDTSLLLVVMPMDVMNEQLPLLKAQWVSGDATDGALRRLQGPGLPDLDGLDRHVRGCDLHPHLQPMSTVLITGANRGIGLEFCRQLQARGDAVVAVCRVPSPELQQLEVRIEAGIDVTSTAAIDDLRQRLGDLAIDVLILNAGLLEADHLESLEAESLRRQFEVNAVAPLLLTRALLPLLHPGARVVLITSRMGSIADNGSGGYYGYRMSKTALCMAGKSLAIDLRPRGIAVGILHPGMVSTRMTGFTASGITPDSSVRGLLQRIDGLDLENSGRFRHANGEELPW